MTGETLMAEPPEAQSFTSAHVQLFVYSIYSRIEYQYMNTLVL